MPPAILTEDEIVGVLAHTALATVVVEGDTDAKVLRYMQKHLGQDAIILPTHGVDKMVRVIHRRSEFQGCNVVFLRDLDSFVVLGVPLIGDVVWTQGCTLENDILYSEEIWELVDCDQQASLRAAIDSVSEWYTYEIESFKQHGTYEVSSKIRRFLDVRTWALREEWKLERGFHPPNPELLALVRENWRQMVRGKQLLEVLLCLCGSYNRDQLLHTCCTLAPSEALKETVKLCRSSLGL